MVIQPVVNIAEICAQKGVEQVVLSPGSRCAPLTLAFARHPQLHVRTVSDERAAAFIALGMATMSGKPTVLVCTSGTAALNYAPAVAEAYYQQIPLLILTADRPPEWIDQQDGQTIRQQYIYGQHIKQSFNFPVDFTQPDAVWHSERMVSEALNSSVAFPAGPVHINIPLREPFYPTPDETITYSQNIKVIQEESPAYHLSDTQLSHLKEELKAYNRVLIVAGQTPHDTVLVAGLEAFSQSHPAVLVGDIISNVQQLRQAVRFQDVVLANKQAQQNASLQPDLLITFGKSVISKSLKQYLRQHKPKAHWHLQPAGQVADTFQTLTKIIRCDPSRFFLSLSSGPDADTVASFTQAWRDADTKAEQFLEAYAAQPIYSELHLVSRVLRQLPQQSFLHLANSMAVRYANIIALRPEQEVEVFANRGTSGIDGSTSTAVGCALSASGIHTLLTGDLAFFYDRNGLWHNYLPPNLRIVLLNNHAGGIFRLIDGPKQQPELAPFFETKQSLDAQNTARDFNLKYIAIHSLEALDAALPAFFSSETGASLLEIFTDSPANAEAFEAYRKAVQQILF
ncbi:2-succinyl-5-enolpyruvyl-6-hydroxy-3-cyclohexene-1-carboxylic-acid synthase [Pontibacter sp. CAU 1760]